MRKNLSKYLISFSTLWYGIIPLIADLTESHLHNANWTPHSKFHLAWLLSTSTLISIYFMYLKWNKYSTIQAALNGLCIMMGFWIASIFKSQYGVCTLIKVLMIFQYLVLTQMSLHLFL